MSTSTEAVESGKTPWESMNWAGAWNGEGSMGSGAGLALRDEVLRFAGRRFSHNQAVALRLTKCTGWQDLLQLQMDWARETFQDYMDESRALFDLAAGQRQVGEQADIPGNGRPEAIRNGAGTEETAAEPSPERSASEHPIEEHQHHA
jgi:hypothetical protein